MAPAERVVVSQPTPACVGMIESQEIVAWAPEKAPETVPETGSETGSETTPPESGTETDPLGLETPRPPLGGVLTRRDSCGTGSIVQFQGSLNARS